MDHRRGNQQGWINPLLKQLNLVLENEDNNNFEKYRAHLEESRLPERIGQVVGNINRAAGYQLLEQSDYLPPQKLVLRISIDKGRIRYAMEIALQENGVALIFYSLNKIPSVWEGYFPRYTRAGNTTTILELMIQPEGIMEENIRMWLSYLLSGLDKKFKPGIEPEAAEASNALLATIFRKVSA